MKLNYDENYKLYIRDIIVHREKTNPQSLNKCSNAIQQTSHNNYKKSNVYASILILDEILIVLHPRSNDLLKGETESWGIYGSS
jgi:hypothetical protein